MDKQNINEINTIIDSLENIKNIYKSDKDDIETQYKQLEELFEDIPRMNELVHKVELFIDKDKELQEKANKLISDFKIELETIAKQ